MLQNRPHTCTTGKDCTVFECILELGIGK